MGQLLCIRENGPPTCAGESPASQPRCGVASVMKWVGRSPQMSPVSGSYSFPASQKPLVHRRSNGWSQAAPVSMKLLEQISQSYWHIDGCERMKHAP